MTPIIFQGARVYALGLTLTFVLCSLTTVALAKHHTGFDLIGLVENPGPFANTELTADDTHITDAELFDFLARADGGGGFVDTGAQKNTFLRYYVVAVFDDGSRVVYSFGAIDPGFGQQQNWLGSLGFGDVSKLDKLLVLSVTPLSRVIGTAEFGTPSEEFILTGWVRHPRTYGLSALQHFPIQETVIEPGTDEFDPRPFEGVPLWALLKRHGIITDPNDPRFNPKVYGLIVVVTGTDNYKAVFSLGEVIARRSDHKANNGQPDDLLVAYKVDGGLLDPEDQIARIVALGDDRHGRWVSAIEGIEAFTTNPCEGPKCFRFRHHRPDDRDDQHD
ncbi:MAG: hypothetical protein L0H63_08910 [Nitrococcus sp.]|nr:hypothetical protein [Nitrococcus sp.]